MNRALLDALVRDIAEQLAVLNDHDRRVDRRGMAGYVPADQLEERSRNIVQALSQNYRIESLDVMFVCPDHGAVKVDILPCCTKCGAETAVFTNERDEPTDPVRVAMRKPVTADAQEPLKGNP